MSREATLETVAAGEPGTRDENTGSFPSALNLPERRPELRAELGSERGTRTSNDPRGGASLLDGIGLRSCYGY